MQFFEDILTYEFLSNALIASFFAAISCAIIGCYLVVRRLVFLAAGITHASFGGVGLAYFAGFNPILGALMFSTGSALAINYLQKHDNIREDSAIGVLWAFGMATGIIFIFLTPGYVPSLMSFLFGDILTITPDILIANGVAAAALTAMMLLFGHLILFVSFDSKFASSQGVNTTLVNNIMMIIISVVIVLIIKLVGIVLLISLLTIAPITVNRFTCSYFKMTIYSALLTIIASFVGIIISYYTDFPSGASIVIVLSLMYAVSRVYCLFKKRF